MNRLCVCAGLYFYSNRLSSHSNAVGVVLAVYAICRQALIHLSPLQCQLAGFRSPRSSSACGRSHVTRPLHRNAPETL